MIYFVVALILFFATLLINEAKSKNQRNNIYIVSAIIFYILFAFRGENVGGDTAFYVSEFLAGLYKDREIGYVLYCDLISFFGDSPFIYIFFTTAISVVPFLFIVHRYSTNPVLSLLYIFCYSGMIICIETNIRQNIATGFVMWAYLIFDSCKWRKFNFKALSLILLFIWGILCHTSMFIVIPICIALYFIPIYKKISIILIIVSFILGGLSSGYIENLFNYFYIFTEGVEGLERLNAYSAGRNLGNYTDVGFNIRSIVFFAWVMLTIIPATKEELNTYFMKLFIAYAIIYNFARSSDLVYRMVYILQLLSFVYIPQKLLNKKYIYYYLLIILLILWLVSLYHICTQPARQNPDACMFPYTFIFM